MTMGDHHLPSQRWELRVAGVLLFLFLLAPAVGRTGESPAPMEVDVDDVLVAVRDGDTDVLTTLARRTDPDPWHVAEQLCLRGETAAATAFAAAAQGPDLAGLGVYVRRRAAEAPTVDVTAAATRIRETARTEEATVVLELLLEIATPADTVVAVELHALAAEELARRAEIDSASRVFEDAGDTARRIGWLVRASETYQQGADNAYAVQKPERALLLFEKALTVQQERDDLDALVAARLRRLQALRQVHGTEAAMSIARQVRDEAHERGTITHELWARRTIRQILAVEGDFEAALAEAHQALDLARSTERPRMEAEALLDIASYHDRRGEISLALRHRQEALEISEAQADPVGAYRALEALAGSFHALQDWEQAKRVLRSALARMHEAGDHDLRARVLAHLGTMHLRAGEIDAALAALHEAKDLISDIPDVSERLQAQATLLDTLGDVAVRLGEPREAIGFFEASLHSWRLLGNRFGQANTLNNLGITYADGLGAYEKALPYYLEALQLGRKLRSRGLTARSLWFLAEAWLELGHPAKALSLLKAAHAQLEDFFTGLPAEQVAAARENWYWLYESAVAAALELGRMDEICFFFESLRAQALRAAMGTSLRGTALPPEMREALAAARRAEGRAALAFREALSLGDDQRIATMGAQLNRARRDIQETVARVRRETGSLGESAYPQVASLREIQSILREGETMVLYGMGIEVAMALVITKDEARTADLGPTARIRAAFDALATHSGVDPGGRRGLELGTGVETPPRPDWRVARARLARLLIEPLALDESTTRLLVAPHTFLFEIPFAFVAPTYEVVHVPSGTAYLLLAKRRGEAGERVLAVGNPDTRGFSRATYGPLADRIARLPPLPGSETEARTIGDVVLIGSDATETRFRSEVVKQRWKALHLACHALLDEEDPLLTSLVLTPEADGEDGLITVLDVLREGMPADLVVLSACETGFGETYRVEGLIGFPRAFLAGGASAVLVSHVHVDDEATRVLMEKFYELWNPASGTPLPAATALRRAQAHVASHERWAHPKCWAAWVLWGLPD